MSTLPETTAPDDDDVSWADRGNYWLGKLNPIPQYKAKRRRVIHRPLVLSGHGIRLHIDRGTLLIRCGFTHYPQKAEQYRFFPQDRQLPSRIVILDGDGSTLNTYSINRCAILKITAANSYLIFSFPRERVKQPKLMYFWYAQKGFSCLKAKIIAVGFSVMKRIKIGLKHYLKAEGAAIKSVFIIR